MGDQLHDLRQASSDALLARRELGAPVPVLVRSRFDGRWCSGFELVATTEVDGAPRARVRRRSDRHELPEWFPIDDLIVEDG